jgi:microcystin-dependent protein
VTLTQGQLGTHTHTINTLDAATSQQQAHAPSNQVFLGNSDPDRLYNTQTTSPAATFNVAAIGPAGTASPQPHENRQPYLVLIFCIALQGAYPARN